MNRWTRSRIHCLRLTLGAASTAAAISLAPGEAKAVLTYNILESGSDVVVQASGKLLLSSYNSSSPIYCGGPGLNYAIAMICTGPGGSLSWGYYGISGPASFAGTAALSTFNTNPTSSGIHTALIGSFSSFWIDPAYASGAAITSTAKYPNQSLAGLGLTTTGLIGTWTLTGSGDVIYACVGPASCVPAASAPSPLPLFGAGAAFTWSRRLRRRLGSATARPSRF